MITAGQQEAIAYITDKFQKDERVLALLIAGSVAHGFSSSDSDIDLDIVISPELYAQKSARNKLSYYESAENIYAKGYFDGKYITLDYLDLIARQGNEPSRFALHDSIIAFDRTGKVRDLLHRIGAYPADQEEETALRFLSQFVGWKWYCDEALRKGNPYLLDVSVTKLILFGGRLILLDNRLFFPYHKWFLRVLENAARKPEGLLSCLQQTLENKTSANINVFFDLIMNYKDWSNGLSYSWTSHFIRDVELNWMTGHEYIENI